MKRTRTRLSEDQAAACGPDHHPASAERVVVDYYPRLGAEQWTVTRSRRLWSLFHSSLTFCIAIRMERWPGQRWRLDRKIYRMQPRSLMVLLPGDTHVTEQLPLADFRVLRLEPDALERWGLAEPRTYRQQLDDPRLWQAMYRVVQALDQTTSPTNSGEELEPLKALFAFFDALRGFEQRPGATSHRDAHRRSPEARELRAALADCHDETRLDSFCSVRDIKPYELTRAFKLEYGLPPSAFRQRIRVERAMAAIRGAEARKQPGRASSLAQIALAAGFADQPHMTKVFRNMVGFTPGCYWSRFHDPVVSIRPRWHGGPHRKVRGCRNLSAFRRKEL
ncbi:MAG: AraC family transcriptional regulator [Proteobacteria bacterium]|nr:AraC family transcriptional regulator [Pseudomonadota bacterium]